MAYDPRRYHLRLVSSRSELIAIFRLLDVHGNELLRSGPVGIPSEVKWSSFNKSQHAIFIVVDKNTVEVVACSFLALHTTVRGYVGDIDYVFTRPDRRGKGIGRAMMEGLMRWVHDFNDNPENEVKIVQLQLVSEPERVQARRLYESLGFGLVDGSDRHYGLKIN
jgi:GNAT superfamily N-acetyltransferase